MAIAVAQLEPCDKENKGVNNTRHSAKPLRFKGIVFIVGFDDLKLFNIHEEVKHCSALLMKKEYFHSADSYSSYKFLEIALSEISIL